MKLSIFRAIRVLPHPAIVGSLLAGLMFVAARVVHGNFEHGAATADVELLSQIGVAGFCGFVVFVLLSAVARSVSFYEVLAGSTRDIILLMDDAGVILEANTAASEGYGYERTELVGMIACRLARTEGECPFHEMSRARRQLTAETRHVRCDGSEFPAEVSLSPVEHYGRRVVIAVVRDITVRKRRQLFEALVHEVDRRILRHESLDSILKFICERMAETYDYALVQLSLKGADGAVDIREFSGEASGFLSDINVRWDESPEGRGPTGTAIRTGKTQIRKLELDEGFRPWLARAREFGINSALAIPIRTNEDVLGALTFFSPHDEFLEIGTGTDLEGFADQIALSIVAIRGQEEIRLQRTALESAANAVMVTNRSGVIIWVNPALARLSGYEKSEIVGQTPRLFCSGNHGQAFYKTMWETILAGDVWRGEIYNQRKDGGVYLEEQTITPVVGDDGLIRNFVSIKQDISERVEHEEKVRFMASHDPLTELPNRRSFMTYLDRAVEQAARGRRGSLLLVNLDNFKLVNESMGHMAGDQMLRQFSMVLKQVFRPSDPIARFDGDVFAVLLEGNAIENATDAAERLRQTAVASGCHAGWEIPSLGLSIGVVEIDGSVDPEVVIHRGEAAVSASKSSGKDRVVVYDSEVQKKAGLVDVGRLAVRIRNALADGRLVLHFQAVVCLDCEQPEHFEALVRMIDENGELIPPDMFLPTAERFGLMREIDLWVVKSVVDRLATNPDLNIFVNLCGSSLTDDELLGAIEQHIISAGLKPGQLTFEITEATAVTDFAAAQGWIHRFKKIGCLFALDDFGVGFSSLSYLRALSVDFVKIDRSFVTDVHTNKTNRAIIQAVLGVATTLGKGVIAEGIETEAHLDTLRSIGVGHGQGYHWGRPATFPRALDDVVGDGSGMQPRVRKERCACEPADVEIAN